MQKQRIATNKILPLGVIVLLLCAALGYFVWHSHNLESDLRAMSIQSERQEAQFASSSKKQSAQIALLQQENKTLSNKYQQKEELTDNLQDQVEKITDTFESVKDYALADPEVLKKYSSVYFLNENYIPKNLTDIPDDYVLNDKQLELRSDVLSHFKDMAKAANNAGNPIEVVSAYRSFGEQADLKGRYVVIYGRDSANTFSADQGYSEHQLGTTVDLTTAELGASFDSFDTTSAYAWLTDNAYKYGFVLSYPKGNPYYEYEPWHWRFVGTELAGDLHDADAYFYDWGQRELDSYRGKVFN